jgi:hypothetical protein
MVSLTLLLFFGIGLVLDMPAECILPVGGQLLEELAQPIQQPG